MERLKNPYNCATCNNEDCTGCGEFAYEQGYEQGYVAGWVSAFDSIEFEEAASEWARGQGWAEPV